MVGISESTTAAEILGDDEVGRRGKINNAQKGVKIDDLHSVEEEHTICRVGKMR